MNEQMNKLVLSQLTQLTYVLFPIRGLIRNLIGNHIRDLIRKIIRDVIRDLIRYLIRDVILTHGPLIQVLIASYLCFSLRYAVWRLLPSRLTPARHNQEFR